MPSFTMPPTPKSQGTTGYGTRLGFDPAAGSPPAIAWLSEQTSIDINYGDRPKVTLTNLTSPNFTEEYLPGPLAPGEIDFEGNSLGDTSQMNLENLQTLQTVIPFEITAPMQQGAKTLTITGFGYLVSHKEGPFKIGEPTKISGKFQMTGPAVKSVA